MYVVKLNYYPVDFVTGLTTSHHPAEDIEVFTTRANGEQWIRRRLEELAGPRKVWIGDPVREHHPTHPSHQEIRDYRYILADLPEVLPDSYRLWFPDSEHMPAGEDEHNYVYRRPDPMAEWLIVERQVR